MVAMYSGTIKLKWNCENEVGKTTDSMRLNEHVDRGNERTGGASSYATDCPLDPGTCK